MFDKRTVAVFTSFNALPEDGQQNVARALQHAASHMYICVLVHVFIKCCVCLHCVLVNNVRNVMRTHLFPGVDVFLFFM
jgi:hypothetical protein